MRGVGEQSGEHLAIEKLGGQCVMCGNKDIRVLQLNHIGKRTRKPNYSDLVDIVEGRQAVDPLDVRCANCNIIYEFTKGKRKSYPNREDLSKALQILGDRPTPPESSV